MLQQLLGQPLSGRPLPHASQMLANPIATPVIIDQDPIDRHVAETADDHDPRHPGPTVRSSASCPSAVGISPEEASACAAVS